MPTLATSRPSTQMWWCPDCQRYCAAHPLDHIDDVHPPQHPDGSRALPERYAAVA